MARAGDVTKKTSLGAQLVALTPRPGLQHNIDHLLTSGATRVCSLRGDNNASVLFTPG